MLKVGNKFIVKKSKNRLHPFYLRVSFNGTWYSIPDEQPHIRGIDPFVGGLPSELNLPPVKINTGEDIRAFNGISRDKTLLTAALYFDEWLGDYVRAGEKGKVLKSFEVVGDKVVDVQYA